jgi:hypothetical protein
MQLYNSLVDLLEANSDVGLWTLKSVSAGTCVHMESVCNISQAITFSVIGIVVRKDMTARVSVSRVCTYTTLRLYQPNLL